MRTLFYCNFRRLLFNYVAVGATNCYATRGAAVRFFESLPLRLRAVKSYNLYVRTFEKNVFAHFHSLVIYRYTFESPAIMECQLAHFLHLFGERNRFQFKTIFESFFFYHVKTVGQSYAFKMGAKTKRPFAYCFYALAERDARKRNAILARLLRNFFMLPGNDTLCRAFNPLQIELPSHVTFFGIVRLLRDLQ